MSYETSYACVTTDNGLASELVHVSPIFARCGPSRRGRFADRRLARTRRTDARNLQRAAIEVVNDSLRWLEDAIAPAATNSASDSLRRYSDAVRGDTSDLSRRTPRHRR